MKKSVTLLLISVLLLSLLPISAFAADSNTISSFELPKPQTPNYFKYEGDLANGNHGILTMLAITDESVATLAQEFDTDSDAFRAKYGLDSFDIQLQYDISLDGESNWQYTSEWDGKSSIGGYGDGYQAVSLRGELMEDFEFFWLTYYEGEGSGWFTALEDAILTGTHNGNTVYTFDTENRSLYIRCRYYMEWTPLVNGEVQEMQTKTSAWSDSAIFGKNSTQVVLDEPTTYEAPVLSGLTIVPSDSASSYYSFNYTQQTPKSVWLAGAYYILYGEGDFDGLETQVSIDGGDWVDAETADAGGDWCLYNGRRLGFTDDSSVTESSNVKLRARFTGTHGPSEWSNVIEINGSTGTSPVGTDGNENSGTPTTPSDTDKCPICGFCPQPLGLCIFIWLAIILIVIVVVIVVISVNKKKNKEKSK